MTDASRTCAVLAEHRLDLARLHPEPADLYLLVGAAEELEHAIGAIADQIAGSIQAGAGIGGERVRHELFGVQIVAPVVAEGEPVAAREQFAFHAGGHRLHPGVENVDCGVGDGPSDGNGPGHAFSRLHDMATGEGSVFRGPVSVDEHAVAHGVEHTVHVWD